MALTYDIRNIDDKDCWFKIPQSQLDKEAKDKEKNKNKIPIFSITRDEREDGTYQMNTLLYVLIFLSMQVGINKITDANVVKVFNRIQFMELLNGKGFMTSGSGKNQTDVRFTLEDVKKYVGLETNVNNLTRSQFIKLQTKRFTI